MEKKIWILIILIFAFILNILGFVSGFMFDIDVLIVISFIVFFPVISLLIYYLIIVINKLRLINSLNKNKESNSNYSNLYVIAADGNKSYNFIKDIKQKKLGLNNIRLEVKYNKIIYSYKYLGFKVIMDIYPKSIKYQIFTSIKYSKNTKVVRILKDKKNITDEKINTSDLCDLCVKLNKIVDEYRSDNYVDDSINGIIFEKISSVKSYLLDAGIVAMFLGGLLIVLSILLSPLIENIKFESFWEIFGLFIYFITIILAIVMGIVGISYINRYKNLLKDFKYASTFNISKYPKKVKLGFSGRYRGFLTIEVIKLKFAEGWVLVALQFPCWMTSIKDVKRCVKEIKQMKCNFTVLSHSKIVVMGHNKIIKHVYKIFR